MTQPLPDVLIDITMTAVRRPEILKRTLHSFYRHMLAPIIDRCRLIINIDPIGDPIASYELCDIAQGYFSRVTVNLPMEPDFPKAFLWTWAQSSAPWVFHLEDDWELLAPVDITAMIAAMGKNPTLASMRLPFFDSAATSMKNWNLWFPWNGKYFTCPQDLRQAAGFCGHPSLLRGEFVRRCTSLIDTRLNPEKQFHGDNNALIMEGLNWDYGVWGQPNSKKVLADIGAEWKVKNKFQKAGSKAFFTQWEKMK